MNSICSGIDFIEEGTWPDNYEPPSYAFALSQHHGLPTTLLDWTRNPNYAAFFAADANKNAYLKSLKSEESDERPDLAVWAVNLKMINTNFNEPNALCTLICPRSESQGDILCQLTIILRKLSWITALSRLWKGSFIAKCTSQASFTYHDISFSRLYELKT